MSQDERYGTRDLAYSYWHRHLSIGRFLRTPQEAEALSAIDIDVCEYDEKTRTPISLMETARDCGRDGKCSDVTTRLAQMAKISAFTVLYSLAESPNPKYPDVPDITGFRVRQDHPKLSGPTWQSMAPSEFANWIKDLHDGKSVSHVGSGVKSTLSACGYARTSVSKKPPRDCPRCGQGSMIFDPYTERYACPGCGRSDS